MQDLKDKVILIILIIGISIILLRLVDNIFKKVLEKNNEIYLRFFKNFIKAIIVIVALYNVFSQSKGFETFSSAILTSSSLLVVVLGFAFQTSLEDFIAGILISIFKPFNIGDRINLINAGISGYVEDISIRHTIIRTFQNNRLIIPNSIMNKETIENSNISDTRSSNFLDISISYDSNLDLAKEIIQKAILTNPNVIDQRTEEQKKENVPQVVVFVRNFGENGIDLRASVWTKNIDENFLTCSNIREEILKEFKKNNIEIPYPHTHLIGNVRIKK